MVRSALLAALLVAAPAFSAQVPDPVTPIARLSLLPTAPALGRVRDYAPRLPLADRETEVVTAQDSVVALGARAFLPVALRIDALAGHLAFASAQDHRQTAGSRFDATNNVLGVGLAKSYGVAVSTKWLLTPFAAIDYNRVDSDRQLNAASPRPYSPDNADIGLTATLGATATHALGGRSRAQLLLFGALVVGAQNSGPSKEASSFGSRIIQSLDSGGPERLWSEVGTGVDVHVSARSMLRASMIQTVGHPDGDALAARLRFSLSL